MVDKIKSILNHIPKWLLSGLTLALILWLTLAPHPTGDIDLPLFPGVDKVVHVIMFGFFALMVCVDYMRAHKWASMSLTTVSCIAFATALFGVGIEFIQEWMGIGRSLEIMDMLADSAGAMAACGVWAVIEGRFASPQE